MTDENSQGHLCPRRGEVGPSNVFKYPTSDTWKDGRCSYCGSLNPDEFMRLIEAKEIKLGPTDKNYKVYVDRVDGAKLPSIKFYFQHLDEEHGRRFVDLYNQKYLIIDIPGHFYVRPFFMVAMPPANPQGAEGGGQ